MGPVACFIFSLMMACMVLLLLIGAFCVIYFRQMYPIGAILVLGAIVLSLCYLVFAIAYERKRRQDGQQQTSFFMPTVTSSEDEKI